MSETIGIWNGETTLYADSRPAPPTILLDIFTQLIHQPHPTRVVDLGCGTGLSTMVWAGRAQQVVGIEPNAEMRQEALHYAATLPQGEQVRFKDGLSTNTDLPAESADIVTCSQSLHWMEPEPTYAEIARILKSSGLFTAYDYDWPPTVHYEMDEVYQEVIARFRQIRAERGVEQGVKSWSKEKHLARMQESGKFRFTKELVVHSVEQGNADRFVALTLSYGIERYLKLGYLTEQEVGLDRLKRVAHEVIGVEPIPWYLSYRVRIGIK